MVLISHFWFAREIASRFSLAIEPKFSFQEVDSEIAFRESISGGLLLTTKIGNYRKHVSREETKNFA